jgi:hypothetical protein
MKDSEHFFFDLPHFEEKCCSAGCAARRHPGRRGQQDAGVVRIRPAGVGHLPRRALLRLRDPGTPRASTSTSGWMPPSATWRASRTCATSAATSTSTLLEGGLRRRALSLHRQGHRLLPLPVLAGHAGRRGLPQADQGQRARLCDRQRRRRCPSPAAPSSRPPPTSKHLDPEYLRYYYAAKLNSRIDDLDLNLEDFVSRVNADLVGKLVNIASRCAGFIAKRFDGKLAGNAEPELYSASSPPAPASPRPTRPASSAAPCARSWRWPTAPTSTSTSSKPWVAGQGPGQAGRGAGRLQPGLNLFRLLVLYLKPVLPRLAASWQCAAAELVPTQRAAAQPSQLNPFTPLFTRIEPATDHGTAEASKSEDRRPKTCKP